MSSVRMPADVDRPDRLLAGLTAAQLGYGAAAAVVVLGTYRALSAVIAPDAALVVAAPLAAVGAALVLGRVDAVDAPRLLRFALTHWLRRGPMVPAQELPALPAWAPHQDAVEPLSFPAAGATSAGIVDLGPDGAAVVCRASSLNFALRNEDEQEAIIAATARWLNSLTGPVQVLVRAERADLSDLVAQLVDNATGLPHPALERAALDHARWLEELASRSDILRRSVLVIFRDPAGSADVLHRRADDAASSLAAAGISLTPLDGAAATEALAAAANPHHRTAHGTALPGSTITGAAR